MNTLSVRANAVIFYALSSLIAFASLSAVTMFNHYPDVVASVTGHDIKEFGLYTYRGIMKPVAKVDLKLDLDIDLRPVFNWNAKQIFVWVMAEYHDDIRPTNQISLWDTIITDPDAAKWTTISISLNDLLISAGLVISPFIKSISISNLSR